MIPIIDIFAGPGGLGEGFCSVLAGRGAPAFEIHLSIEMDEFAHETLRLRSFYRLFDRDQVPANYYDHLRGRITLKELYCRHPEQARLARRKAWRATLGKTSLARVRTCITAALQGQEHGDHWVLIGGPPCQSYSLAESFKNVDNAEYDTENYIRRQAWRS